MKGFVSFKLDGGGRIGLSVFSIASYNSCYSNEYTCIRTTDGEKHTVKSPFADVEKALVAAMEDASVNTQSKKLNSSDVTKNVWIPIENGLPVPHTNVWIAYKRYPEGYIYTDCIGYYDRYEGRWCVSTTHEPIEGTITHWRPIKDDYIPGGTR